MVEDYREWLLGMVIMYGTESPISAGYHGTNMSMAYARGHAEHRKLKGGWKRKSINSDWIPEEITDYANHYLTQKAIDYLENENGNDATV